MKGFRVYICLFGTLCALCSPRNRGYMIRKKCSYSMVLVLIVLMTACMNLHDLNQALQVRIFKNQLFDPTLPQCLPGFTANTGTVNLDSSSMCTPCPVGFFKSQQGAQKCSMCPLNTTTIYAGALSQEDCHNFRRNKEQLSIQLRVIVLTMNRGKSLLRLLQTLQQGIYKDDVVAVDIWIDVVNSSHIDPLVLKIAQNFIWTQGPKTVHIQSTPAGLRGQWLYTWDRSIPGGLKDSTKEIPLILEDDLVLSPYFWQWLRAGHKAYENRPDIAGFTLQRDPGTLRIIDRKKIEPSQNFLFPFVGSWGFSPTSKHWNNFTRWARIYQKHEHLYKPYVVGTIFTEWYKTFEKQGRCPGRNCMWTQLHLKYTSMFPDRYTVYANCPYETSLSSNYRETGVHYGAGSVGLGQKTDEILKNNFPSSLYSFVPNASKFNIQGHVIL